MTSNQSHKAVVFGSISIDKIVNKYGAFSNVLGGSAAYALLANKKNTCELVGVVGNDFQQKHFNLLSGHSISTNSLTKLDGNTFCWGGEYKNDFNTRVTHVTHLNVLEFYKPSINKGSINFDLVMLGNLDPVIQMDIYSQVKNDNNFVILDTMNYWIEKTQKELFEIICKVNLVVINDEESKMLGKSDSIEECAKNILSCGPDYIIIKKGSHGAELFSKHQRSAIPALDNIKVVDPTGAGDSFVGGVCGYLALQPSISFKEIHNAMIHGAVIASFCIEEFGLARLQKISKENIDKRIKTFAKHLL